MTSIEHVTYLLNHHEDHVGLRLSSHWVETEEPSSEFVGVPFAPDSFSFGQFGGYLNVKMQCMLIVDSSMGVSLPSNFNEGLSLWHAK